MRNDPEMYRGEDWHCDAHQKTAILEKSKKPWEDKRLSLNEYQEAAQKTANFHGCLAMEDSHIKSYYQAEALIYCSLGLAGESGEVVELTKKLLRDDQLNLTDERKERFKEELGDVMWYIANLSKALGFTLEEIADCNIQKLKKRHGICSDTGVPKNS